MLKPYFKLENVQQGGIRISQPIVWPYFFKEVDNIAKYHEDVEAFEVYDRDGRFLAVLYTDFFPTRKQRRWCLDDRIQRPA